MKELKAALILSLPILGAYWFLGITYGLLASDMGYPMWIPLVMALVVYSGSVEFIALTLLMGTFHPLSAMTMALMVASRHLFYGISMLDRYQGSGWRKPLLILWLTDETFAVNYANKGSHVQYLWISLLSYLYWSSGALTGYLLGGVLGEQLTSHLRGLDFVVTAMFLAIFMDDYIRRESGHLSAWTGILAAMACLVVFGADKFIIPTMLCILGTLFIRFKVKKE